MDTVDPMGEIRASYFVECEELLEALQDGLQLIHDDLSDEETINVVFRAVHSIKGGAGAFGLEQLVQFAHSFETFLDALRTDKIEHSKATTNLSFRCTDHLADLIQSGRDKTECDEEQGRALVAELISMSGSKQINAETEFETINFVPAKLDPQFGPLPSLASPPLSVATTVVHFSPHAELYDVGNEPYFILHALRQIAACNIECHTDKIPSLAHLDPEIPKLSWVISFYQSVDEREIEAVFEFVDGLCDLTIYPAVSDENENVAHKKKVLEAPQNSPPSRVKTTKSKSAATKSVVRVDLDRIERLVNLVGELVINQAMLAEILDTAGLSPHSDAMNSLDEFQRLTRDIQESVMMIRAQPVKSLFQRMSRIVREASAAVDKDVRLITVGDTTEIDKTVIERLADPLTHMIRNAVDHGLETSQERRTAGKSSQGSITLSAAHKSGRVIIEIKDDGAGVNCQRVKQIAIEKGLIAPDVQLTKTEIDNLIYMPGFSTVDEITDLSGRGVGMDIVRNAIQSLGGRISTASTPGQGTTFSISLPLTLAVLDGMVVQAAGETLVLPLSVVSETLTLNTFNIEHLATGSDVVRVRDALLPLYDLGAALGFRNKLDHYQEEVAMIIQMDGNRKAALLVDEILDQRQIVIKGLDDSYFRAPGIAAATILGDGQVALILDPTEIIEAAQDHPKMRQA